MNESSDNQPDHDSRLDRILAELLQRADAGEPIDRQQLLHEHTEFAEQLEAFFATSDLIDSMAGPVLLPKSEEICVSTANGATPDKPNETLLWREADSNEQDSFATTAPMASLHDRGPPTRVLGDYELLKEIGRGGMGVVYKARQIRLDRFVAVKMILAGGWASDADLKRFYAEAQAAGRLAHPNIITIHQVGQFEGHHFFSMDFVDGRDLAALSREEEISAERAARYMLTVARAIHIAHERGILHRDLKPANVLIDENDNPVVTDFGLAKYVEQDEKLTATGAALGTPSYMPPEQAAGHTVTRASDVYSLGAILYTLLTRQAPFRGESLVQTVLDVMHKEPEPPSTFDSTVDRNLEAICLKCLQKEPKHRYASAADLADDLQRFLNGQPIAARPTGQVERAVRWIRDVPIVAALTGKTVTHPTAWHHRFQWFAFSLILIAIVFFVAWLTWPPAEKPMPERIRIASALPGGQYYEISEALMPALSEHAGRPVEVLETGGSQQNARMLIDGEAHLALLQMGAIESDAIAVVTPLYYDLVTISKRHGRVFRHSLRYHSSAHAS